MWRMQQFTTYAQKRLDGCKFGDDKPACTKCKVHCYQSVMRERIRIVMRFSGPFMPLVHPIETARALYALSV